MLPTTQARASAATVPFRTTEASAVLDLLRGLAALLVLFDHTRHLFFGESVFFSPHGLSALPYWLFEGLTNSGPQAVVIFFVLSGYLVAGSALRWMQGGSWSWRRYMIHRLVRLWLVLLPALLLGGLWDLCRMRLFLPAGTSFVALHLTWTSFFGNLFFLQTLKTFTFGSNRPLWSLSFEFWFYLLFPLGALIWLQRRLWAVLANALLLVALCLFVGHVMLALFPVWLLGALLTQAPTLKVRSSFRALSAVVYATSYIFIASHPWRAHLIKPGYVLGLLTAVYCWIVLSGHQGIAQNGAFARASRGLAGFSYSLYLVHYPLLAFLSAALLRSSGPWTPVPTRLAAGIGLVFLCVLYAWIVSRCTEAHTDAVRSWFEKRWVKPAIRPSSSHVQQDRALTLP